MRAASRCASKNSASSSGVERRGEPKREQGCRSAGADDDAPVEQPASRRLGFGRRVCFAEPTERGRHSIAFNLLTTARPTVASDAIAGRTRPCRRAWEPGIVQWPGSPRRSVSVPAAGRKFEPVARRDRTRWQALCRRAWPNFKCAALALFSRGARPRAFFEARSITIHRRAGTSPAAKWVYRQHLTSASRSSPPACGRWRSRRLASLHPSASRRARTLRALGRSRSGPG